MDKVANEFQRGKRYRPQCISRCSIKNNPLKGNKSKNAKNPDVQRILPSFVKTVVSQFMRGRVEPPLEHQIPFIMFEWFDQWTNEGQQ